MPIYVSEAIGLTDKGRVRKSNQDAFLCLLDQNLFAVADGMGGHAGGEVASRLCIESISKGIDYKKCLTLHRENAHFDVQMEMREALNRASMRIFDSSLETPELRGMGTTCTVLTILDNCCYFAHVGDSRCYLVRAGFVFLLTDDHSLVSEQVRAGIITRKDAEHHQLRNVITRSVGYQEAEEVDSGYLFLEPDDRLFLTSDGFHGKVREDELSSFEVGEKTPDLKHFIDLANLRGGEDNITVVFIKIDLKS